MCCFDNIFTLIGTYCQLLFPNHVTCYWMSLLYFCIYMWIFSNVANNTRGNWVKSKVVTNISGIDNVFSFLRNSLKFTTWFISNERDLTIRAYILIGLFYELSHWLMGWYIYNVYLSLSHFKRPFSKLMTSILILSRSCIKHYRWSFNRIWINFL